MRRAKASERRQGRSPGEALERKIRAKDLKIGVSILLDNVLVEQNSEDQFAFAI